MPDPARKTEFHPTTDYFAKRSRTRGRCRARILISGLALHLDGLSEEDESLIRERYGLFVTDRAEREGEPRIKVLEAGVPHFLRFQATPKTGPEYYRLEQSWEGHRLLIYSYEFAGWYDGTAGEGAIALVAGDAASNYRAIENYLRVITAYRVLQEGGFLLHGAGLVEKGRAHVFFGRSGSGKTTVTLLSEGKRVLGDDLVLIRNLPRGAEASGVPFRGLYREPPETDQAFPLAGLYRLLQHPEDSLEMLSPAQGAAELMTSLPFVVEGEEGTQRALAVVGETVSRVPTYRLRFRKSSDFWKMLDTD